MKRSGIIYFSLLCTFFLFADFSYAADNNPLTLNLDELTVTAAKRAIPVGDSPASVTIIKKEEIQNVPGEKLEDVFLRVPDVTLTKSHWTECAAREITLRGVPEQNKTLVLMDDIPLNGPAHGWLSLSLIPKEAIERIEIVRGPMSALYGSGAMGGVINIITKKPKKAKETIVNASYGSLKTISSSMFQSGVTNRVSYFFGGSYYDSDGYVAAKTPKAYNNNSGRNENNAIAKFIWSNDDNSTLTLGMAHVNEKVDRGRIYIGHNYMMNNTYFIYNKSLGNGSSIEGTTYWKNQNWNVKFDRRPAFNYLYQTEYHELIDRGATFRKTFNSDSKNIVTAGVDYKLSNLTMKDYFHSGAARVGGGHGDQSLFSVFAQDEIRRGDNKLVFTLGARGDFCQSYNGSSFDTNPAPKPAINNKYDNKNWKSFSPKAGIVYHASDKTTVRASIGKAFAAPNLMKMYTVMQRGTTFVNGNPNLDPETAVSYELGFDHSFAKNFTAKLSLYRTSSDNFISNRTVTATSMLYDNISKVKIDGAEAEFNYKLNKRWSGFAGYTFSKSVIQDDKSDPALKGNDLSFAPRKKARLGFTYAGAKGFSADMSLRFMGNSFIDLKNTPADILKSYRTCDITLNKRTGKNEKISLGIENISNVKYDLYGIPDDKSVAPGRVVTLGLTRTF